MTKSELEKTVEELNKKELDTFVNKMVDAQMNSSLICFVGAGISASQGYANWNGYVERLIEYWESHLQILTQYESTLYDYVEGTDIEILEWLKKQNYSNKLKVNLVHEIVKKYCLRKDDRILNMNLYQNYVNDFEKYYFINVHPIKQRNEILDELVKQSGLFITTNYDQQIEKAYEKEYQRKPEVIKDAQDISDDRVYPDTTIIHLHGTPTKDNVLLVSSADSYNELYFDHPEYREKLLYQIDQRQSPLIVFVGSSLQEEEILHYLKDDNKKSNKYAIMKYSFSDGEVGKQEAQLIKKYYEENRQIKIIWYGKNYDDLPNFLKILNKKIEKEKRRRNKLIDPSELRELLASEDEENFEFLFSKAIKKQDTPIIDLLFKDVLNENELNLIINNKTFIRSLEKGREYSDFWRVINKNWNNYTDNLKKEICNLTQKLSRYNQCDDILEILSKYTCHLHQNDRFSVYLKSAQKFLINYPFPERLHANEERCAWLITNFEKNKTSVINFVGKAKFNLFSSALTLLLENLKSIYYGTNFELLINSSSDSRVRTLSLLIENRQLTYKNNFPKKFYQNRLIQRILINLALKEKLAGNYLPSLIKNFSDNVQDMGKETNKFLEKYIPNQYQGPDYYFDGVFVSKVLDKSKPFYKVSLLTSEQDIDNLIAKLRKALTLKENYYYNLSAQIEATIKVLTNKTQWIRNKKEVETFLIRIIEDKDLIKPYISMVNRIVIKGFKYLKDDNDTLIEDYLNRVAQYQPLIFEKDYLLNYLADNGSEKQIKVLGDFLFKSTKLTQLSFYLKDGENKRWISHSDFVPTTGFNYCILAKKIERRFPTILEQNSKHLRENINCLNKKERLYMKGVFYLLFNISNPDDEELKTSECFVGFSHSYYLSIKTAQNFREATKELLNSNFDDNFCSENLVREMVLEVSPTFVDMSVNIENKQYIVFLIKDIILKYLEQELPNPNNALNWIRWGVKNFVQVTGILYNFIIDHINNGKIQDLIKIIEDTNIQVKSIELKPIYFKDTEHYTSIDMKNLILLIQKLDDKLLIKPDGNTIFAFSNYLEGISKFGSKNLIKELLGITKEFVPQEVQKSFEEKYL